MILLSCGIMVNAATCGIYGSQTLNVAGKMGMLDVFSNSCPRGEAEMDIVDYKTRTLKDNKKMVFLSQISGTGSGTQIQVTLNDIFYLGND